MKWLEGILSIFGVFDKALEWWNNRQQQKAGADAEKLEQEKRANAVRENMEGVDPSGKRGTVDRLRDNGF